MKAVVCNSPQHDDAQRRALGGQGVLDRVAQAAAALCGLPPATKARGIGVTEKHIHGTERGTWRIETFSDCVIAIAITLLILEIKPPSVQGPSRFSLLRGLISLWPSYFAYILSFVTIGIYWARHHYIFALYQKTDHVFKLLNLLFLMCISFLPFPTEVLAEHMTGGEIQDETNQTTAVTFYAIGLLLPAVSWTLIWLYASRRYRLIDRHLEPGFVRHLTVLYSGTVVLYLAAVLVSLISFRAGLATCVGLTLLYLLPPRDPVYVGRTS